MIYIPNATDDLIIKKYESQPPLRFQNRLEYHVIYVPCNAKVLAIQV